VHNADRLRDAGASGMQTVVTAPRIRLAHGAPTTTSHARVLTLIDARVPSGQAQILAWDVVRHGPHDLSTWLCRSADGAHFLLCRAGTRPTIPAEIVPLSPARALTWFDTHAVRFADRSELWDNTMSQRHPA
jgi:hypothetical protein